MQKQSNPHPIFFARQHYDRVRAERHRLDFRYQLHLNHSLCLHVLGFTRHNQHTKRRMLEHFGPFRPEAWWQARLTAAALHGRICVPHPACPEAFELCAWVTYAEAVAITGRSADTFARWRWDPATVPDEAVWRLLEWTVHACCGWPARPPRIAHNAAGQDPGAADLDADPLPAVAP